MQLFKLQTVLTNFSSLAHNRRDRHITIGYFSEFFEVLKLETPKSKHFFILRIHIFVYQK